VTGAQCFDKWFDIVRRPAIAETFCRQIGLARGSTDPAVRLLGAVQLQPPRAPFIVDWIRRIRTSNSTRLRKHPNPRPASSLSSSRVGGH
jgi:hypothetical protein